MTDETQRALAWVEAQIKGFRGGKAGEEAIEILRQGLAEIWQPIEKAPKNGNFVRIKHTFGEEDAQYIFHKPKGFSKRPCWMNRQKQPLIYDHEPTHWKQTLDTRHSSWQPIEMMPNKIKDGRQVLVGRMTRDHRHAANKMLAQVVHRSRNHWIVRDAVNFRIKWEPTHFMILEVPE